MDIATLLKDACEIARAGGESTLRYFGRNPDVELKADDTPVTIADREAETLMRDMIRSRFPDHGILGEEFGVENEQAPIRWILDPIDGTRSFIHGIPLYTTLLAVLIDNSPAIGIIYSPATNEFCDAGRGLGTRLNGEPVRVRECADLKDATYLTTEPSNCAVEGYGDAHDALCRQCRMDRSWGDAYGHMMVACGRADIMFDPILEVWDAAALQPVVEEAGGIFSDTAGQYTIHTGNAISASPTLYPQVMACFSDS